MEKYDPTTGASLLDLQAKICRVERIKSFKELPESVDKWEKRYKKYRAKVGKELDDLTRQNILLQMLPPKWEQKMRFQMHTRGRETVYATLRHELLDLAINVAGPMAIGMDLDDISPEGANGIYSTTWFESLPDELREMLIDHENNGDDDDDDEDLDALRKGGGKKGGGRKGGGRDDKGAGRKGQGRDAKGQGRDAKPRCDVCNKPGHLKADCWSNPNSKVFKGEEFRNKVLKSAKNIGEDDEEPAVGGRLKGLGGLELGGCFRDLAPCMCEDSESDECSDEESQGPSDEDGIENEEFGDENEKLEVDDAAEPRGSRKEESDRSDSRESDPWQSEAGDPWKHGGVSRATAPRPRPAVPVSWMVGKIGSTETKHTEVGDIMRAFNEKAANFLKPKTVEPEKKMTISPHRSSPGSSKAPPSSAPSATESILEAFEEKIKRFNTVMAMGASREVPPPPDEGGLPETHGVSRFMMTPNLLGCEEVAVQATVKTEAKWVQTEEFEGSNTVQSGVPSFSSITDPEVTRVLQCPGEQAQSQPDRSIDTVVIPSHVAKECDERCPMPAVAEDEGECRGEERTFVTLPLQNPDAAPALEGTIPDTPSVKPKRQKPSTRKAKEDTAEKMAEINTPLLNTAENMAEMNTPLLSTAENMAEMNTPLLTQPESSGVSIRSARSAAELEPPPGLKASANRRAIRAGMKNQRAFKDKGKMLSIVKASCTGRSCGDPECRSLTPATTKRVRPDTESPHSLFDFDELDNIETQEVKVIEVHETKSEAQGHVKKPKILKTLVPFKELEASERKKGIKTKHKKEKDENGFIKIHNGVTSDSGASDTVAPEDFFTDYPLEESPGSRSNVWYVGAGGERIKNQGQRQILILTKEKHLRWLTVQVARVKKLLGSVSKNNDCGQRVVYDTDDSYIMDKVTGEKVHLERAKGVFKYDAWVVPNEMIKKGRISYVDNTGTMRTVPVDRSSSFSRQG